MFTLGHKHSEETRKKMSEKAKLRVGELNHWFGKLHTDETKEKMSRAKRIENCPCAKCGVVKTDENTNRVKSGKQIGQFMAYCKPCFCRAGAEWARDNRPKVNLKSKNKRAAFRSRLHLLKSERPCYDCGGRFIPEVMDFDHVLGTKLFAVSTGHAQSWEDVQKEIDKCQCVCANCHRVRTKNRREGVV